MYEVEIQKNREVSVNATAERILTCSDNLDE